MIQIAKVDFGIDFINSDWSRVLIAELNYYLHSIWEMGRYLESKNLPD